MNALRKAKKAVKRMLSATDEHHPFRLALAASADESGMVLRHSLSAPEDPNRVIRGALGVVFGAATREIRGMSLDMTRDSVRVSDREGTEMFVGPKMQLFLFEEPGTTVTIRGDQYVRVDDLKDVRYGQRRK